MTNVDHEGWSRVKGRLRAEVGDDVYSSWFARMDLEAIEEGTVRLSVPTRFLKSWIQSHYAERVLACWQAEQTQVGRIELTVRSAVLRTAIAKPKPELEAGVIEGLRQTGGLWQARRCRDVQPALHPCRRRLGQDASIAGHHLDGKCHR